MAKEGRRVGGSRIAPVQPNGRHRRQRYVSVLSALIWFAISYGVAIGGYLLLNASASRLLSPSLFGYFVVAMTTSTVAGQIGLMGVHRAGLREAARMAEHDDEGMLALRRGVRAVLVLALPVASVVSGAITFALANDYATSTRLLMAGGMTLMVLLGGQQKLWANYLRGFGDVRFASLLEGRSGGALVASLQAIGLYSVYKWWPDAGLGVAMAVVALGFALPVLGAARRVTRRWRHVRPSGHVFSDFGLVLRRDWRFATNQVAAYLNATVEIWIAGVLLSSLDTSMFSAAQRLALLLAVPLTSIQIVFAPVCARMLASGDMQKLERLLRTGGTLAAVVTAVAWVPMLTVPGPLLDVVYGAGFTGGATVLFALTVGSMANVASGLCGTALTMSHHEGSVAAVQVVACVIRIGVGVAAAMIWGLNGLGAAAAVVTIAMYFAMWRLAKVRLGLRTEPTLRPRLGLVRRTIS
ncbi:MAG TPA: lipopolysaccharide biosynthesis protein [Nocardioidaceae bacterium]|nr:lipopolysaccharide biosynthesis protein [Nocardioidaceae bacterium]